MTPTPPRHALATACLAVTSTLLTCLVLETGLRIAGDHVPLQSEWMLSHPNLSADADVILSRPRFTDPALFVPAAPPLVVALGDSYTEGFPVDVQRSYPSVLTRLLARRGQRVTVRNFGMGDTGPDQQLRFLEHRILPVLRPTVIVWQLYANDVWDNVIKAVSVLHDGQLEPIDARWNWLALRQWFFTWTPLPNAVKKESRLFRRLLYAVEPRARPGDEDAIVAGSLAKLEAQLDRFGALARRDGFHPYLLLVAPQIVYLDPLGPEQVGAWNVVAQERLTTILARRPGFIDGFLGAGRGDDFFDGTRDLGARGHRHLNERGYARLAALVAHRLMRDGALEAAHR